MNDEILRFLILKEVHFDKKKTFILSSGLSTRVYGSDMNFK